MGDFGAWWDSLTSIYKAFWATSIISSLIFVIMVILSIIGGDSDSDTDAHGGGGGGDGMMSYILSFKTILAFLLGASWTGLSALYQGSSIFAIALISIISGVLMMALMAFLLSLFVKLQYDSTMKMDDAIGAKGVAYVTIPPQGKTGGQVEILINNSYKTFDAITDETLPISTEEPIEVIQLLEGNVMLVRRQKYIENYEEEHLELE